MSTDEDRPLRKFVPLSEKTNRILNDVKQGNISVEEEFGFTGSPEELPIDEPYLLPKDELKILQGREEQVGLDRQLRARRGHVRRLEYENKIESRLEPLSYRVRLIPYTPAVKRALSRAGRGAIGLAQPPSRSDKLKRKYGIRRSNKSLLTLFTPATRRALKTERVQ